MRQYTFQVIAIASTTQDTYKVVAEQQNIPEISTPQLKLDNKHYTYYLTHHIPKWPHNKSSKAGSPKSPQRNKTWFGKNMK
jgi:hypothetical protein